MTVRVPRASLARTCADCAPTGGAAAPGGGWGVRVFTATCFTLAAGLEPPAGGSRIHLAKLAARSASSRRLERPDDAVVRILLPRAGRAEPLVQPVDQVRHRLEPLGDHTQTVLEEVRRLDAEG